MRTISTIYITGISLAFIIFANLSFFSAKVHAFDQDSWLKDFSKVQSQSYRRNASFISPVFKKRPNGQNTLTAKVNLSTQRMEVYINDSFWQEWKISSGHGRYRTPTGQYRPFRMHKDWYSRKYDNAPMPYSVFFHGGYAIHGTNHIKSLGRPASHGCIRLHPKHAAEFFAKVNDFGMYKTRIVITR